MTYRPLHRLGALVSIPGMCLRGGEVRIVITDPEAIGAVHEFLDFQRREHRT